MWPITSMTKVIDHQQTGKRKWIRGPGLKKDRDLKIYENQSKLDLAADNYLKKVNENSEIIRPKNLKKEVDYRTIRKNEKKIFKKKQKAIKSIINLKQHLEFLPMSKFDKISILKSLENIKIRITSNE